jgi:c-di-GMP-binding flagellar brake protein YcgR
LKTYSSNEIAISLGCQNGYYTKVANGMSVTVEVTGHSVVATAHYN